MLLTRQIQRQAASSQAPHQTIFSRSTTTARNFRKQEQFNSTTLLQKHYMPPNVQGRTHLHSNCFPDYESQIARQGQLEKVGSPDEVFAWYTRFASHPKHRRKWHHEMVGGRIVHGSPQYARAFRRRIVPGTRVPNCQFNETEVEHSKFNGNQSRRGR